MAVRAPEIDNGKLNSNLSKACFQERSAFGLAVPRKKIRSMSSRSFVALSVLTVKVALVVPAIPDVVAEIELAVRVLVKTLFQYKPAEPMVPELLAPGRMLPEESMLVLEPEAPELLKMAVPETVRLPPLIVRPFPAVKRPAEVMVPEPVVVRLPDVEMLIPLDKSEPRIKPAKASLLYEMAAELEISALEIDPARASEL